jgi:hypothetical protein
MSVLFVVVVLTFSALFPPFPFLPCCLLSRTFNLIAHYLSKTVDYFHAGDGSKVTSPKHSKETEL